MNQKERKAEERELQEAVSVLSAKLRGIARRKAARFEQEFLIRVRDMIDEEIGVRADVSKISAEMTGRDVAREIQKQ